MEKDHQSLFTLGDRTLAEEVQRYLDGFRIFTLLVSDNPSSSVMNAMMGSGPLEKIDIRVNRDDHDRALEVLKDSPYKELVRS